MIRAIRYALAQPRYRPCRHFTLNQWVRGFIENYVEDGRAWYYRHWPRRGQAEY